MSEHMQEKQERQSTRSLSRRRSLLGLGSAGLIALLAVPRNGSVNAKKKRRRKRAADACQPAAEDCTVEISQTCSRQQDECNAFFAPLCADEDAPRNCAEAMVICCSALGTCQATAFLDCFLQIIRPVGEPV